MTQSTPMKRFDRTMGTESIVREEEARFEQELGRLTERICADKALRVLTLSGPTCSGKTTTANKLIQKFADEGRNIHVISIDDFYFDKTVLHQRAAMDESIEIDYDSVDTIDVALLARCVDDILSGKTVDLPIFDFKSGQRRGYKPLRAAREDDMFVFEGIQAIYPEIRDILAPYAFKSLFINAESGIDFEGTVFLPEEIRLYRRLVRDYHFRNATPEFTFYLWKSVRENEIRSIFPHVHTCDYRIDSTLSFELGLIKPYLLDVLTRCPEADAQKHEVGDILTKMGAIPEIPKSYLADDSLYYEFLTRG